MRHGNTSRKTGAVVLLAVILCSPAFVSCEENPRPVLFPVHGVDQTLFGLSREAAEGILYFSGQRTLEYSFADTPAAARSADVPSALFSVVPMSLELSYSFITPPEAGTANPGKVILDFGGNTWVLPLSPAGGTIISYAVPAAYPFPGRFNISVQKDDSVGVEKTSKNNALALQIHSIECKERWYGYYHRRDAAGDRLYASPFVSGRPGGTAWVIDISGEFDVPEGFTAVFNADLPPGKEAVFETGNMRFEASPRLERFVIPAGIVTPNVEHFVFSGDRAVSFHISYAKTLPFPKPVPADPGQILAWPRERWRNSRYEVFRWDSFPSLLIFDFADYAVQDRMLKRLAFFVEKAGFRGRLAPDSEIADLHGWNAHDYRAVDLARFFQAAREINFPLLAEERELENILLEAGIIRESGGTLREGEGGIISISRESDNNLRYRFIAHEGFHGLFFIDEEFRAFSRQRWQRFPAEAKRFIRSFFEYQRYDISDEYLLINEFMAHILQQSVSQAPWYFGEYLPSRIEESPWRMAHLPEKDQASGTWPSLITAFTREAESFSVYVNDRWGLGAGRVNLVTVRRP